MIIDALHYTRKLSDYLYEYGFIGQPTEEELARALWRVAEDAYKHEHGPPLPEGVSREEWIARWLNEYINSRFPQ